MSDHDKGPCYNQNGLMAKDWCKECQAQVLAKGAENVSYLEVSSHGSARWLLWERELLRCMVQELQQEKEDLQKRSRFALSCLGEAETALRVGVRSICLPSTVRFTTDELRRITRVSLNPEEKSDG